VAAGCVAAGTFYDVLPHRFHEERNGAGEYVPLRDRAPSVRTGLCRVVVEDSVALTFGEGRFPAIDCEDKPTRATLAALIKDTNLPAVMHEAALRGSVGSVVALMRVLRGRVFWSVLDSLYLTPDYDPEAPDTLVRVTERYKVRDAALKAAGYDIADDKTHGLGFVPMVWIKNLPGGTDPDGWCTFRPAIETVIETDYQLSQAGRGLKYPSDPTLLIKEPAATDGQMVRSPANALVVSEGGDAKLLEIGGTAAAVMEYTPGLREAVLESMPANLFFKANPTTITWGGLPAHRKGGARDRAAGSSFLR
jgi:hypothetical protein